MAGKKSLFFLHPLSEPERVVAARRSKTEDKSQSLPQWSYWDILIIAAVLVRFLVPTEGVDQGQTLWIATGWLILLALRAWWLTSQTQWKPPSLRLPDLALLLLVGGHTLSSLLILTGEGDRRAALNGLWEWIALGATWVVLRERFESGLFRQALLRSLWITCVCLSLFGLWQHFVWYPQQARDLNELLVLREKVESQSPLSAEERLKYSQLSSKMGTELFSLDDGSRTALLNRAAHSLEPIGRFALANSFAAVLIVGFFLSLEVLLRERPYFYTRRWWTAAAVLLLISLCLILTKSRTAILAVSFVLVLTAFFHSYQFRWAPQRIWTIAGVSLLVVLLIGILIGTGGIDQEVLSEAPKSLQYRLEYWQATLNMLRDHPLFGVGPGNFRQNYVQYKLPGSSEEILDPHNFLLDAWANGGLIALGGVLLLIGSGLWVGLRFPTSSQLPPSPFPSRMVLISGALACGAVFAEQWLFEGFTDRTILAIAGLWLIAGFILNKFLPEETSTSGLALAMFIALWLHLLGAGGLGMPAIFLLLLLTLLYRLPLTSGATEAESVIPSWTGAFLKTVSLTGMSLGVLCLWSSLIPVLTTTVLIERSRNIVAAQGNVRTAEQLLKEAIAADSLAPEPHHQLAMLYAHRWRSDFFRNWKSDSPQYVDFDNAVQELKETFRLDPRGAKRRLLLANLWLERYPADPRPEVAEQAMKAAQDGIERYPEYAPLWFALAKASKLANQPHEDAARKAIALDDLNRRNGHVDKTLSARDRAELEGLMK